MLISGGKFTSFSDLALSWTAVNPPNGVLGDIWGNFSLASGWPPPNNNSGSVYSMQGGFNPRTTSRISIDYVDSSNQLIIHGFGAAVDNIDSGKFLVSLFLCSPFCESSPSGWYGPVTFSSFSVELVGATPAVPEPSTWAMLLIGFAAIGFAGYRSSRPRSSERFINHQRSPHASAHRQG